ncbi:hypothetical protein KUV24_01565 [Nitratireductor sp. DP7N14-4]|nr:hypothetical protein [Nitratireductor sp. DP7N14-4]
MSQLIFYVLGVVSGMAFAILIIRYDNLSSRDDEDELARFDDEKSTF